MTRPVPGNFKVIGVTGLRGSAAFSVDKKVRSERADFCQTSRRGATHAAGRIPGDASARVRGKVSGRAASFESTTSHRRSIWRYSSSTERTSVRYRIDAGVERLSIDLIVAAAEEAAHFHSGHRAFSIPTCRCATIGVRGDQSGQSDLPHHPRHQSRRAGHESSATWRWTHNLHGHDGVFVGTEIANDESVEILPGRRWSRPRPDATPGPPT